MSLPADLDPVRNLYAVTEALGSPAVYAQTTGRVLIVSYLTARDGLAWTVYAHLTPAGARELSKRLYEAAEAIKQWEGEQP